jgi:hypothetical protein
MTDSLVKSVSIANLLNQRTGILAKVSQALALLAEADQLARAAHVDFPSVLIEKTGRYVNGSLRITGRHAAERDRQDAQAFIQRFLDASAWEYLMSESGIQTFMNAATREKWSEALGGETIPPLTEDNISATFATLYASRGEMFDQGVLSCFKSLSWQYKTNLPQKFGKRIVVSYLTGHYNHQRKCNELDDLMRVFHVLDGKPEADHRHGIYVNLSDAGAFYRSPTGMMQNDYLKIR